MAKILVADDNSNIQKMVVLALKDQGIDVVAVGNGEAAVRKISDVHPDLVLADVFMPVRNGYEVCQYVKADSALCHIPVILLVGAFDPLDEQEAQRVGADGVLKKPFVPPDPLISMVKSALARAGVSHGSASAAKTPEPAALRAKDLLGPRSAPVPTLASSPFEVARHEEPASTQFNNSSPEEIPARPAPVKIATDSKTVAFGSLLETPAEEMEGDPGILPSGNPELESARDWRDTDLDETAEEEEKPAAPWRPGAAGEADAETESNPAALDWRAGSFEQIQARRKQQAETWESTEEKPDLTEAAKTVPEVGAGVKGVPEAPAVIPETRNVPPPAPIVADAWAQASPQGSQEESAADTAIALEKVAQSVIQETSPAEPAAPSTPEAATSEPDRKASEGSWFSVASNPWDADVAKASRLASGWDVTALPAPSEASNGTERIAEGISHTAQAAIEEASLPESAVEAIREEAAQVAENARLAEALPVAGEPHAESPEGATPTSQPTMDELVAKVLAKMSPEVLQAVTREILKPVVEAMVKEEMKSKKP